VRIQEAKERDNSLASTVWAIGRELDEVEENVQYLTPQSVASLKDTHRRIGKLIERAEAAKRP